MRQVLKSIGIIELIILSFSVLSCESETEFQKIELDWTNDIIENIGHNINPNKEYTYWALLRSNDGGHERVDILNEFGDLSKRELIDLDYKPAGFLVRGHHFNRAYYIIAIDDEEIIEIKNTESLLSFLGEIDTMEEALLITQLNEFDIDYCDERGGSYRKTKDGFEFQLRRSNSPNTSIIVIDWYALIQYLVYVKEDGTLTSESCGIYCEGKKDCIDCI